jgi:hypothetical protein
MIDRIWSFDARWSILLSLISMTCIGHSEINLSSIGPLIALFVLEEYQKMPLLNLVVALIVVGVALWLVNRYIPMASSIKTILNVVVVVAVAVFVLKSAGLWGDVTSFRIGH